MSNFGRGAQGGRGTNLNTGRGAKDWKKFNPNFKKFTSSDSKVKDQGSKPLYLVHSASGISTNFYERYDRWLNVEILKYGPEYQSMFIDEDVDIRSLEEKIAEDDNAMLAEVPTEREYWDIDTSENEKMKLIMNAIPEAD